MIPDKEIKKAATDFVCDNFEVGRNPQELARPSFTAYAMIDSFKQGAQWAVSEMLGQESEGFKERDAEIKLHQMETERSTMVIRSKDAEIKELRKCVRGLVRSLEFYSNEEYMKKDPQVPYWLMGDRARALLKDHAETIERCL